MSAATGKPTVEEVALLIRTRTKDSAGREVGTFDDETRPTGADVQKHIDVSFDLVCSRLPPVDKLAPELLPALAGVVAYRAALRVEKSYWPEQVLSDRSAYDQLHAEYLEELEALVEASAEPGGTTEPTGGAGDIGMLKVGSWTSIE